jgi:hypothetical protein
MKYYKTNDTWTNFFSFVTSRLNNIDKDSISFLRKNSDDKQDIFIATQNQLALKLLAEKYVLTECKSPYNVFDNDWAFTGNHELFEMTL